MERFKKNSKEANKNSENSPIRAADTISISED